MGEYTTQGTISNLATYDDMQRAASGKGDSAHTAETLLALAQERAPDPSVFDTNPPYFFEAIISTSARDAYYTYMEPSTLENFARGAADGVGVQDSHNSYQLGLGRSLTGELVDLTVKGKKVQGVRSHFFTIPGLGPAASGGNPLAYIDGIRSGAYSDISVGFSIPAENGQMRCSICGQNMLDWMSCGHLSGLWYGEETRVIAEGHIEQGELNEYSPVYDGATPGAAVAKALAMAKEGMISADEAERLTSLYGTRILVPRQFALGTTRKTDSAPTTPKKKTPQEVKDMEFREQVTHTLLAAGITLKRGATDEDVLASMDEALAALQTAKAALTEKDGEVAELTGKLEALEAEAEDGRAYRADMIDGAVADLVRSLPEEDRASFDEAAQKEAFQRMPLQNLKTLRAGWAKQSVFQAGRGSQEEADPETPVAKHKRRPKAAQFVG